MVYFLFWLHVNPERLLHILLALVTFLAPILRDIELLLRLLVLGLLIGVEEELIEGFCTEGRSFWLGFRWSFDLFSGYITIFD